MDLDPAAFDDQVGSLRTHGEVSSLDAALELLEANTARTDTHVVVTFDDGASDFVDVVLPILVRHDVPATLYVATGYVGDRFPWGAPAASWAGLREAASTGLVTIGSHTHTHAVMDKVSAQDADDEARRSIDAIGEQIGVAPLHFAYPKGVPGSPEVVATLADHFRSIACADVGMNEWQRTDPTRLRRSPITRSDTPEWFARKASGGLRLEGVARESLNRVRYRRRRV